MAKIMETNRNFHVFLVDLKVTSRLYYTPLKCTIWCVRLSCIYNSLRYTLTENRFLP